ncbi:hypothetical protein [Calorimonas adulescens]|uniref:DUF2680 domain-containing protein n=1 Tax=Calorimonas adulescens TaxID=2606906 RepID=A0A5D8Q8N4_9THEO|nr:hypothetical protein [Calorimonas adulescens]TZE80747.1 hypothetical protein FWJ32_12040 [Calorimonas adulescens]
MKKWIIISIVAVVLLMGAVVYAADAVPFGNGFGYGMMGANPYYTVEINGIAKILGFTPEQLTDEMQKGKTIYQIADEKGITVDDLTEKLKSYNKDVLDKLVEDELLTQEQADSIYEYQKTYSTPGYFGGCPGAGPGLGYSAGYRGPGMMYRYNQGL